MVLAGCGSSGEKATNGMGGSPAGDAAAGTKASIPGGGGAGGAEVGGPVDGVAADAPSSNPTGDGSVDTPASSPAGWDGGLETSSAGGGGGTRASSSGAAGNTGTLPSGGAAAGTTASPSTTLSLAGSTGTVPTGGSNLGGTAILSGGGLAASSSANAGTTTVVGGTPQAGQTDLGGTTAAGGTSVVGGTTGTTPVACGSRDIPIDSAGWVDLAATGCNIQGVWWWATDGKGSPLEGVTADKPPYVPGKGMCIKGRTVADPEHTAWGAALGLDLNSNQVAGWNATAQGVVGFDMEITGSSTAELRVEYESESSRTTGMPPFVAGSPGRIVALIDRAVVPSDWDVVNKGEKVDPRSIRKLQLHAASGSAAADFDVCVSRIRPIVATCSDYALVDANGFKLNNNVWGKGTLTDYSQCVFTTGSGLDTCYGWTWRWPGTASSGTPRAYPEIMAGMSPWNEVNTGHNLPTPISSEVSFSFNLDLVLGASDAYDFAPEVWLTSEAQPKSTNVTDEIMFWFLHRTMVPAGSKVGTFSNAGVSYDVWVNPHHDPGANNPYKGWQYIAFVAQSEIRKGTILLKPFIDYLLDSGRIASNRYFAGVEVGTEIVNGSGSAIISNFSVNVVP